MTAVITTNAPRPRIFWEEARHDVRSAYGAVKITSAVNLLEDRAYGQLDRIERLSTLLREEQSFISAMRDVGIPVAFDLRIVADPDRSIPLDIGLVARVWEEDQPAENSRYLQESLTDVLSQLKSSLPRHVTADLVDDAAELRSFLQPFDAGVPVRSAVITKREVLGDPKRPDAKVGYYFSVLPLNWLENDWTQLYSMLAASRERVVVSVGLIPMQLPPQFSDMLQRMATFYGRLATPGYVAGRSVLRAADSASRCLRGRCRADVLRLCAALRRERVRFPYPGVVLQPVSATRPRGDAWLSRLTQRGGRWEPPRTRPGYVRLRDPHSGLNRRGAARTLEPRGDRLHRVARQGGDLVTP